VTTTITELFEKLKKLDEITLMELLEIDSEMLIERFKDEIDDNYEKLLEAVEG
jgi:anion-transporting  ArsA/GET3 family ATPase